MFQRESWAVPWLLLTRHFCFLCPLAAQSHLPRVTNVQTWVTTMSPHSDRISVSVGLSHAPWGTPKRCWCGSHSAGRCGCTEHSHGREEGKPLLHPKYQHRWRQFLVAPTQLRAGFCCFLCWGQHCCVLGTATASKGEGEHCRFMRAGGAVPLSLLGDCSVAVVQGWGLSAQQH